MPFIFKLDGIIATKASIAKPPTLAVKKGVHAVPAEIGERVRFNEGGG